MSCFLFGSRLPANASSGQARRPRPSYGDARGLESVSAGWPPALLSSSIAGAIHRFHAGYFKTRPLGAPCRITPATAERLTGRPGGSYRGFPSYFRARRLDALNLFRNSSFRRTDQAGPGSGNPESVSTRLAYIRSEHKHRRRSGGARRALRADRCRRGADVAPGRPAFGAAVGREVACGARAPRAAAAAGARLSLGARSGGEHQVQAANVSGNHCQFG